MSAAYVAANSYYSANYESARARFRTASNKATLNTAGAKTWNFPVPSQSERDLSVDYLYLPAQKIKHRLVVLVSGVHGMEGFAGSAIQLMFLREFALRFDRVNTGYLIVHSLNPFGFKNHRRATEANVNLNRNFSQSAALYQTKNEPYLDLRDTVEPSAPVSNAAAGFLTMTVQLAARIFLGDLSIASINQSIGQGQYSSPQGLEYGGARPEPQVADFLATLQTIAEPYSDIVLLDLHTGLGEKSRLHLMPGDAERSVDPELFAQLFRPDEDRAIYQYTPNNTVGFYRTFGDLNNAVPELLQPKQRSVAVTLEFGTIGSGRLAKMATLSRLILENQAYHHGYTDNFLGRAAKERVQADFAALFYPNDPEWRNTIIENSRLLFERMLQR